VPECVGRPFVGRHEKVRQPGAELLRQRHTQRRASDDRVVLCGRDDGVEALADLSRRWGRIEAAVEDPYEAECDEADGRGVAEHGPPTVAQADDGDGDHDDRDDRERVVPRQQRDRARDSAQSSRDWIRIVEATQQAIRQREQCHRERDVDHGEVGKADEHRRGEPERGGYGAAPGSGEAPAEHVEQERRGETLDDGHTPGDQEHVVEATGGAVLGDEAVGVVEPCAVAVGLVIRDDGMRQQRGQRGEDLRQRAVLGVHAKIVTGHDGDT